MLYERTAFRHRFALFLTLGPHSTYILKTSAVNFIDTKDAIGFQPMMICYVVLVKKLTILVFHLT